MIKEYLEERKKLLNNIIRQNKEKYDHNQIAIDESHNQIKELDEMVDEATKIFSVKAREDNGFKNQEISDLKNKIAKYVIENNDYEKNINNAKTELSVVEKCLVEIKDNKKINKVSEESSKVGDVSRETSQNRNIKNVCSGVRFSEDDNRVNNYNNIENQELVTKLEFCKSIAEIDGKRVTIELDNIINMINE